MSAPYGFRETPGLEEDETQQHRVPHTGPDGSHHVAARRDTLHQNGVNRHADHDKHPLEPYGEKGLEIVVPHMPGLHAAVQGIRHHLAKTTALRYGSRTDAFVRFCQARTKNIL